MFATIVRKRIRHIRNKYFPYFDPVAVERRQRLNSSYRWVERSSDAKEVLLLVCGYKPLLWEAFFKRIETFTPKEMDVCLVCPGFNAHPKLEEIAERNAWSILLCKKNQLSVAQNLAILHHPHAEVVHKLDEDVLITRHYFLGMHRLMDRFENESKYTAGFYAPLLHINGYSYHRVLDRLNLSEAYEEKFGPIRSQCVDIPVWSDGRAAEFMWAAISPLDETAARFYQQNGSYTLCPHRFSIGALSFYRDVWEDLNYFVNAPAGWLGLEEIQLAEYCARESKVAVISDEVLVGHFSFGPQYDWMKEYYKKNPQLLDIKEG